MKYLIVNSFFYSALIRGMSFTFSDYCFPQIPQLFADFFTRMTKTDIQINLIDSHKYKHPWF